MMSLRYINMKHTCTDIGIENRTTTIPMVLPYQLISFCIFWKPAPYLDHNVRCQQYPERDLTGNEGTVDQS
jgi:hypothetical protein